MALGSRASKPKNLRSVSEGLNCQTDVDFGSPSLTLRVTKATPPLGDRLPELFHSMKKHLSYAFFVRRYRR